MARKQDISTGNTQKVPKLESVSYFEAPVISSQLASIDRSVMKIYEVDIRMRMSSVAIQGAQQYGPAQPLMNKEPQQGYGDVQEAA